MTDLDNATAILARQFAVDMAFRALEPSIDTDPDEVVDFAATLARFILDGTQAAVPVVSDDDALFDPASDLSALPAPIPSVSAEAIDPAAVVPPSPVAETPAPVAPVAIENAVEPTAALTDPNPAPASAPIANDPAAQAPAVPTPAA